MIVKDKGKTLRFFFHLKIENTVLQEIECNLRELTDLRCVQACCLSGNYNNSYGFATGLRTGVDGLGISDISMFKYQFKFCSISALKQLWQNDYL